MGVQQVRFTDIECILNKDDLMPKFGQVRRAESQPCSVSDLKECDLMLS